MTAAGRNDPCPCGSGKKYKHCCGLAATRPAVREPAPAIQPRDIGALVALVNAGALEDAERRVRALLTKHQKAGILWKILSVTLMRQNKDALRELRKTVELLPDDAEAHGNLGAALCDSGQWAEALPCLRRALAIDPQNAEALLDTANACATLGRADEAIELYQRALARNPASLQAHNNLGLALASLGRREEAVACYERALALEPRHAEALDNLGNALRELGHGARADRSPVAPSRSTASRPAATIVSVRRSSSDGGSMRRRRAFARPWLSSRITCLPTWGSPPHCARRGARARRSRSARPLSPSPPEAPRLCRCSPSCGPTSGDSRRRRSSPEGHRGGSELSARLLQPRPASENDRDGYFMASRRRDSARTSAAARQRDRAAVRPRQIFR